MTGQTGKRLNKPVTKKYTKKELQAMAENTQKPMGLTPSYLKPKCTTKAAGIPELEVEQGLLGWLK